MNEANDPDSLQPGSEGFNRRIGERLHCRHPDASDEHMSQPPITGTDVSPLEDQAASAGAAVNCVPARCGAMRAGDPLATWNSNAPVEGLADALSTDESASHTA